MGAGMATKSADLEAAPAAGCPPLDTWQLAAASYEPDGRTLHAIGEDDRFLLVSPPFEVEGPGAASARLDFAFLEGGAASFGALDPERNAWFAIESIEPGGRRYATIAWPCAERRTVQLVLSNHGKRARIRPTGVTLERHAEVPPPEYWTPGDGARWLADERLSVLSAGLVSQPFRITGGHLVLFGIDFEVEGGATTYFMLREANEGPTLARRILSKSGDFRTAITVRPERDVEVEIVLATMGKAKFRFDGFEVHDYGDDELAWRPPDEAEDVSDTALPHWNGFQRAIHARCKRSRVFNSFISSIEMRLGCEEVLSLPSYFAICPTGQCNALCAFCSVTINRTGIIKKQLPLDHVAKFLQPVAKTISLYGLEGNGEPTLHTQFRRLVQTLTNEGSKVYLISNGSRLTPELLRLLMHDRIDSVNFSLNAATGPTHRAIMKLRNFDEIVGNIRALARGRGDGAGWGKSPIVSVSMVVTEDNIHEVVDFLRLGEERLEVDRIYIRPLSELGNELGAVEDLRGLEPSESAVRDMLEGVADYLASTPRKAVVYLNPDNFRAVRSDPSDSVYRPRGFGDQLLAPRGKYWTTVDPGLLVRWGFDRVRVTGDAGTPVLLESAPVAVEPGRAQTCEFAAWSARPNVSLCVCDASGAVVESVLLPATPEGHMRSLSVSVTPADGFVTFQLRHSGGDVDFEIVFQRLMSPGPVRRAKPCLPPAHRWELDAPAVKIAWHGRQLSLKGVREPGLYVVKSYGASCSRDQDIALPIELLVREGQLGIGILNERSDAFLTTMVFAPGFHEATLAFRSGENRAFRAVLYAVNGDTVDAVVDWQDSMVASPMVASPPPPGLRAVAPLAQGRPGQRARMARRRQVMQRKRLSARWVLSEPARPRHWLYSKWVRLGQGLSARTTRLPAMPWLRRLLFGRVRYYCQKPWTDLANFTVDGRVDVCCIATGASQEAFALGNLMNPSFQDVWNGEKARTFRRTVNSADPLPPCRRCPMAYGYQGTFFDRAYTLDWIGNQLIGVRLLGWTRGFRGARVLQYVLYHPLRLVLYTPIYLACSFVFFRGFRR